jgi:predicted RND superfamily exporter protein
VTWLSDLFTRHRPWIGTLAALVSLLAIWGALQTSVDDVPSSIFRSNDEHYERLEQVFTDFGTDDGDCLIVVESEEILNSRGVALLRSLEDRLADIDGIEAVWSLDDLVSVEEGALLPSPLLPPAGAPPEAFAAAAARVQSHPLASDLLLSPDGAAAVVVAQLAGAHLPIRVLRKRVSDIRAVLEELSVAGFELSVTGIPPLRVVIFDTITREQLVFPPISALLAAVIGLLIFRRPAPVIITMTASGLAALWALGFMGLVGQPLNLLTASLPLLVMVIAFTDAIHLMIHTLRARREGLGAVGAAAHSIRELGLPCALTSLTTAIGFGSLAISRVEVIQRFGGVFAAAVGMSFVVVLTVVPLGSSFWLHDSKRRSLADRYSGLHRPAERLIRAVLRRPRLVSAVGVAVVGVCLMLALRLVPENRLTESTPSDNAAAKALTTLEEHFGGVLTTSVLVEWSPERSWDEPELRAVLAGVRDALDRSPFTRAPRSVLDLLAMLPPGLRSPQGLAFLPKELVGRYLREDLGRALVHSRVPDAGSAVCEPAYAALDADLTTLRAAHPDVSLELTGTGYVARRNVNLIIRDFSLGLGLAAGVIFIVLGVAFRSLRLGAVSLLANAFPVVFAAAGLQVAGLELQVPSVLAFTVLLGIAVDDTIHYVSRYRRELESGLDVDEALVQAFLNVGRALVMTTIVLTLGFGVELFSALPTSRLFALIVIIGLGAALIGDLLLLPAAIKAFGGRRQG